MKRLSCKPLCWKSKYFTINGELNRKYFFWLWNSFGTLIELLLISLWRESSHWSSGVGRKNNQHQKRYYPKEISQHSRKLSQFYGFTRVVGIPRMSWCHDTRLNQEVMLWYWQMLPFLCRNPPTPRDWDQRFDNSKLQSFSTQESFIQQSIIYSQSYNL